MQKLNHPVEKLVETFLYNGVEFEVVERPEVLWVGCVDYASNNADESDIGATLERYQKFVEIPKKELINPDWSAALSINYGVDKPCGIMFAQETYSDKQDERYDLFTQPGGLWLRIRNDRNAAALLGKESAEVDEYFQMNGKYCALPPNQTTISRISEFALRWNIIVTLNTAPRPTRLTPIFQL